MDPASVPVRRDSRPPVLGIGRILANLLSRTEGRGELVARGARELGDVFRLPVPGMNVLILSHPRDLRRVMIQNAANYRKSYDYGFLERVLGKGLITSEGEIWASDRRLQHPLFHGRALEQFFGTIAACSEAMLARWEPGKVIDLEEEAARYTLHVIGERILSLDVREWVGEIRECFAECQKQIIRRGLSLIDIARWVPTPGELSFRRALRRLDRVVEELIERRKRLPGDPCDLYSILSQSPEGARRLRDQILTLFLAGHETTAVALTWTFYSLASHPEAEAGIAREAAAVLQGKPPVRESLERLELATQAINESLRLYPPVASMGREALADDELGGYRVPKGSIVVICPFATHRRPDLWPRPEEYDPARFSAENRKSHVPGAFIPFITGPRACIGQHLAMWELQVAVAMIAERFALRRANQDRILCKPMVSLRPSRPVLMTVERRAFGG